MIVLFVRTIITYVLVFIVIRLTGKRQLSELQPFDFVITLLIADLAAVPVSDTSLPLAYGIVPIVALFLIQKTVSFLALKSVNFRTMLCGKPLVIISQGIIAETTMREASYTVRDLMEQLRGKDVFSLTNVAYAILETNGDLSVLLKSEEQTMTRGDMNLNQETVAPDVILIVDGKRTEQGREIGKALDSALRSNGCTSDGEVLLAVIDADNVLYVQTKQKFGMRTFVHQLKAGVSI